MVLQSISFSCYSKLSHPYVAFGTVVDAFNESQRSRVLSGSSLNATGVLWTQHRTLSSLSQHSQFAMDMIQQTCEVAIECSSLNGILSLF